MLANKTNPLVLAILVVAFVMSLINSETFVAVITGVGAVFQVINWLEWNSAQYLDGVQE